MTTVVFLGPSLPRDQACALIDAEFRPPAAQGDIYRAVRTGARAIGLIDGLFRDVASVWHREILHALTQGVHVFGAASMGALRAAELDGFGMRGVGVIYTAFRDGAWPGRPDPFEDDDEVAVVHAPAAAGFAALSDAMVDLRATLLSAAASGRITEQRCRALIGDMKRLHYPRRTMGMLAEAEPALRGWLAGNAVRQKALDAAAMLRAMASFLSAGPGLHVPSFQFERAQVWEAFVAGQAAHDASPDAARVLDTLRLDPLAWRSALRGVLGRTAAPPMSDRAERLRQLARLRQSHGLWQRADLAAWMRDNGIDEAGLNRLLDGEAALDGLQERSRSGLPEIALTSALLDHLRVTNAYADLLRRARPIDAMSAGRPSSVVLDWYFTSLGQQVPKDLDAWVARAGWPTRSRFDNAVAHAYRLGLAKPLRSCSTTSNPDPA